MADQWDKSAISRGAVSGGGVHEAARDVSACQDRFFPVLHVFYVAQHEERIDGLFQRTYTNRSTGILAAKSMAEYSRHFIGVFAGRRAPRVHDSIHSGGDAGGELRDLRAGLRIMRKHSLPTGERRVS